MLRRLTARDFASGRGDTDNGVGQDAILDELRRPAIEGCQRDDHLATAKREGQALGRARRAGSQPARAALWGPGARPGGDRRRRREQPLSAAKR